MDTVKNNLRRIMCATGLGTFCAIGSGAAVAVILSVAGLATHIVGYLGHDDLENYSLNHRFSAAYNINAPESHKYYYVNGTANSYGMTAEIMYAILGSSALLSGALGGRIGVWLAKDYESELRRRKERKLNRRIR